MLFGLVLHEKEVTAGPLLERPVVAEAHMDSRLRPWYVVVDVIDCSNGGVSVMKLSEPVTRVSFAL